MANPRHANDSGAGESAELPHPCPVCGRPRDPAFRPFCSKRCANIDLHRWLSGSYSIPAETGAEQPDAGERHDDKTSEA